jgi:hypothetical protein
MNEMKLKQDIYQNINDNEVLSQAQNFGFVHILKAKECVIPYRMDDDIYIFLSFKKKGDSGYMYIRIQNPEKNLFEVATMMRSFMEKMNCKDMESHIPATNVN